MRGGGWLKPIREPETAIGKLSFFDKKAPTRTGHLTLKIVYNLVNWYLGSETYVPHIGTC